MTTVRSSKRTILHAIFLGAAMGLLPIGDALSRDTDIYFSNPNALQESIKPNVMLILDTSGSMVSNTLSDGRTRLAHMKDALQIILDEMQNVNVGLMRFSSHPAGGPVLFPVMDIDAQVPEAPIGVSIVTGADDAEELISTGAVNLSSNDLDIITGGGGDQIIGVRFQNIHIPQGAQVTNARLIFEAAQDGSSTANYTIAGERTGDAPAFTTAAFNLSSRTKTSATVSWSPGGWTQGAQDQSPDIAAIVNEIIDLGAWCGGNSMAFFISGPSGTGVRRAKTYEFDAIEHFGSARLVIEYTNSTIGATEGCIRKTITRRVSANRDDAEQSFGNNPGDHNNAFLPVGDKFVGFRFQGVPVPRNAVIVDARLDLTTSHSDSGAATYSIVGHRSASSPEFGTGNNNIGSRIDNSPVTVPPERTRTVTWSSVPVSTGANQVLTTPNLKDIVEDITALSAWDSGDNMVIIFENDSGLRRIRSRDGNSSQAALLTITFEDRQPASAPTVRQHLKQIVAGMNASGWTPVVDTLWEAGLYFRGENVRFGRVRGPRSGTDARYTRVSHPLSYTGGSGVVRATGCTDADLDASACVSEEITGTPTYKHPFEDGCQNSYIVLLTDGEPNTNGAANQSRPNIETLIGGTCPSTFTDPDTGTSYTAGDGRCAVPLAKHYFDNNLSSFTDKHNVVVHTIGFGSDVTSAKDVAFLKAVAHAGGGTFNSASDASELATAFQNIFAQVLDDPTAFVSPSLSVNAFNRLFDRDEVYFSLFEPRKQRAWPGNIKKFSLCNDVTGGACVFGAVMDAAGQPAIDTSNDPVTGKPRNKIKLSARSFWTDVSEDGPRVRVGGAGAEIAASSSRNVYTYTGESFPPSPVDLTGSAHVVNTANVTKTMLGNASMTNARHTEIVNWMRGLNVRGETDESTPPATPADRWKFADALHSRPLTVTYGGTTASPIIKIFVGTSDGGVRMIDAANGAEEWIVYIPEMLEKQSVLMDSSLESDPFGTHIEDIGMDGSPTAYVIDNNGNGIIEPESGTGLNDKVYLYIGQRRGGRGIYAFDVTPQSTNGVIRPKFLWRIHGGGGSADPFDRLGQTWSRPKITKIRVKCTGTGCVGSEVKTVLAFAGGYDPRYDAPGTNNVYPTGNDHMGNAIFFVDPLTGTLVYRISSTADTSANLRLAGMNYAIPSDLALVDTDSDGAIDRVYVGDLRGQLWRIDLGTQIDPASSVDGGSRGYVFANIGGTTRQEHRKFFYAPEVSFVTDGHYSTVPDYDLIAIPTGDREDPLDKLTAEVSSTEVPVNNRLYVFRDYKIKTGSPADSDTSTPSVWDPPAPLTETDLHDATTSTLNTLSGAALTTVRAQKGWYISLKEPSSWIGEKGLAEPTIFQGVLLFTTFLPINDSGSASSGTCAPLAEGTGRVYAINYLTGQGVFDLDGDGTIDQFIEVGGGIPSDAVIVNREGGVTTLVGTSGGAASPGTGFGPPIWGTYWYQD